jgi:hypothetical protein
MMLRVSTHATLSWPLATALWAITGFVFYVLGGMGSLLALAALEGVLPPELRPAAGSITLSIRNGAHLFAWAALSAGASMVVGRRLITGLRFGPGGWVLLGAGTALAAFTMFMVNEDVRARFGYFDPEYANLAFFASPAVLAIALAGWATLAVPPGRGAVLAVAAGAAAGALGLSLLPSLPAATDGIDADHVPLALAFVADLAFAGIAAVVVAARVLRPSREVDSPASG